MYVCYVCFVLVYSVQDTVSCAGGNLVVYRWNLGLKENRCAMISLYFSGFIPGTTESTIILPARKVEQQSTCLLFLPFLPSFNTLVFLQNVHTAPD